MTTNGPSSTTRVGSAEVLAAALPDRKIGVGRILRLSGTGIGLILLIAIFGALRPTVFLTVGNFVNILEQISILAIIAAVQTVVMVVGDFDLSVGSTASLGGALTAVLLMAGWSIPLAVAVALIVGALVGAVNGVLVSYLKLSAFIATLATMTSVTGLAFIVTDGANIFGFTKDFLPLGQGRFLGVPVPVYVAAAVSLLIWALLRFTTIGRRWRAVGGNAEVARLSGIRVDWVRFVAFVIAGLGSALAGIILVSRLASATAQAGDSQMMLAVAAVFLGMTMSSYGGANIGGTLVGVAILGVLTNGLNIVGVNTYVQQLLTGFIIVAAVGLSRLGQDRR
ncbi:MAG: dolichyl-phosphate beta-glucosyltransferase [Actinobacteria bacterium HGW-Actinobacteria-5]|jgi:ribose transport system permease protein|nr:MAG: dolichyl-phosphate beta-glucosyltransferase [Actinobacteria bacterium HGW-Actinobacteria-5]